MFAAASPTTWHGAPSALPSHGHRRATQLPIPSELPRPANQELATKLKVYEVAHPGITMGANAKVFAGIEEVAARAGSGGRQARTERLAPGEGGLDLTALRRLLQSQGEEV